MSLLTPVHLFAVFSLGIFALTSHTITISSLQTVEDDAKAVGREFEDVTENATQAARSIVNELGEIVSGIRHRINISDISIPDINFPDIDLSETDLFVLENLYNLDPDIEQAPFPPPIMGGQKDAPDYVIDIPHTAGGENPTYEPREIGVPVGTTVMWVNKDISDHTVTTSAIKDGRSNQSTSSPPESFDSGHIPGRRDTFVPGVASFGGSFIYTFDKPGVYQYICTIHPEHTGRVIVGDTIQLGQEGKMILMEGANLPFNASELSRIVVAIVPSKEVIDLPPTTVITYNVSISGPAPGSNQTGLAQNTPNQMLLQSTQFTDSDGILYLELMPQPPANSTQSGFVTWGPDISGTATGPHTGAYHIKGPVLVQDEPYTLTVSIVNIDERILSDPITEEFILSSDLITN